MTAVNVPLTCGAADCKLDQGARVTDAGMDFIRCPTCRVLHIAPENLIHSTVRPDPAGKLSIAMKLLMVMRMRWLVRELPRLDDEDVRIADIGCGDGQFLEFLGAWGYRHVFGIEPEGVRAHNARKRGVLVFTSQQEAQAVGLLQRGIDFLFLWQVLEHIDSPAGFVEEYARWLAPSGIMLITVPNQASVQTRLFGFFSAYPDYGRHIWYHTEDYLHWFARNFPGLETSLLRDRNYEYEIFSWVDSIASTITRSQNFVHKAVKKGEGSIALRLSATFLAMCLLPVATMLAVLSIHVGLGSTLTFVLRPRRSVPKNLGISSPNLRQTTTA
jgi:SAM-dependent methyltransferase